MPGTTYDAMRAAIVSAVSGIDPSYTPGADSRWCAVHAPEDVASTSLRNFYVDIEVPAGTGDFFGGCERVAASVRIETSYGGLSRAEARTVAARDRQDLWSQLHRLGIDGTPVLDSQGFEENFEDGAQWGAHLFELEYFEPLNLEPDP